MSAFNWNYHRGPNPYATASWRLLTLWASFEGEWSVKAGNKTIVSSGDQVIGRDLEDAKQRAQAAAMIHQLREQRI
jgi:hypothetical protein